MMFFLAQFFGFVALILSCDALFKQDKKQFLLFEALVDIFYALSYFMLNSYVAGVLSIISMVAMIVLFIAQNKNKYKLFVLIFFVLIEICIGFLFEVSLSSVFLIVGTIMFTFGFYSNNLQITRLFIILPNIIFIVFNLFCGAYSNAFLDIIETVVACYAVFKFYLKDKKSIKNKVFKLNN